MGIKLGDISPLAGAVSGKGLFGKGLGMLNSALGPMAGIMPRMAGAAQKKNARRAASAAEAAAMQKADIDAKRNTAAGVTMKKGGKVKKMAKGGSASRRADGCATQGKTKGRFV